MTLNAWLPIGYSLPDGGKTGSAIFEGVNWQIFRTQDDGAALIVQNELVCRWINAGLIVPGQFRSFKFGDALLWEITSDATQRLCPVAQGTSPDSKVEALSFALSLKATRRIDKDSPLQDALYVEKMSRLLPTYSIS